MLLFLHQNVKLCYRLIHLYKAEDAMHPLLMLMDM